MISGAATGRGGDFEMVVVDAEVKWVGGAEDGGVLVTAVAWGGEG